MSLDVKILDLDQKVDFASGDVTNFLNIRLPSGKIIKVLTTDQDAANVIAEVQAAKRVFNGREPADVPPPVTKTAANGPVFAPRPPTDAFVFEDIDSAPTNLPPLDSEEVDEPIVPPQTGRPMRARQVEAMDGGLPNVPRADDREVDEDGVPGM